MYFIVHVHFCWFIKDIMYVFTCSPIPIPCSISPDVDLCCVTCPSHFILSVPGWHKL